MIMRVGSKNPTKIEAVKECFPAFDVEVVAANSGISEQPKSLEEAIEGSQNRAQWKENGKNWGIGIESGIMPVGRISSGWMNIVACTIWDGKTLNTGMASGFVVPDEFIKIVLADDVDLSEAAFQADFTPETRIGYKKGIIHKLTNGKMDRKQYIKQAIEMAMIQVNHPELF